MLQTLKSLRRYGPAGTRCLSSLKQCDVAIVGGGVIGASVALHLAATGLDKRVVVLEPDASYARASAPRSAGGIRQQFSLAANVELSLYGVDFLKRGLQKLCQGVDVDTDVQFKEHGYLLLATPEGESALRENNAVQHAAGAPWIRLMDPLQLSAKFPWLRTDGIALGAFGQQNEGYFDPWVLLQAMRKAAMAKGVEFIQQPVTDIRMSGSHIEALCLGDGAEVNAATVVNAAGAYGGKLVQMCGDVTPLPVVPRKRCIFMFHVGQEASSCSFPRPSDDTPLTIDSSGVYFRSEGSRGRFLCGVSPRPEDDHDCTSPDDMDFVDHDLFEDVIWPALAERAPALEAIKLESSWAGFYEYNTLDQNGVVGWHTDVPNLMIACGFSGHGLQQAPGVGRAVAELLSDGGYKSIDLSIFGFDRICRNEPVLERGIY